MAQLGEFDGDNNQAAAALRDGLQQLSQDGVFTFTQYTRVVLPVDGFVFWSRQATQGLVVKGSLHYQQEISQAEDETYGAGNVRFTTGQAIPEFAAAPINQLWVGRLPDGSRYTFSAQQGRYDPVGQWHYFGRVLAPVMAAQLIDTPGQIDPSRAVTSNSLALWLGLNTFASDFDLGFSSQGVPFIKAPVTLYPHGLVPANLPPPYGTVKIGDDDTTAWQSVPYLDANRSHWQLCEDRVRITLFGLQSDEAEDFQDTVNQYTLVTENFGLCNVPVFRDATRYEPGMMVRAMKKVADYIISYNQRRVFTFARQLITSCTPTYYYQ